MNASGQSVCLCMIVKDEAPVIRRCLDSVGPLIDHWLIVDTGSTDGTQDIIRAHLAGLPGALHERPWRDFAHNRSEALALARPLADYSLIIDADDEMLVPPDFRLPRLEADSYSVDITDANIAYQRSQLVRNALPWRYVGVLHEYLTCEGAGPGAHLPLLMRRNHDGRRRRDPHTYGNDVAVLEKALASETDPFLCARYTFYLAQSQRDRGETAAAIDVYLLRADMGYWDQEIFVSLYQAAKLMEALGRDGEEILATYQRATDACPTRAEAAHGASRYCRLKDDFSRGYVLAKPAIDLPAPVGGLFVETWIYDYGLLDECAVNAYWAGAYEACAGACRAMLRTPGVPPDDRERASRNLGFALDRLKEAARPPVTPWRPDRPLGGTELMVEGLLARLGGAIEAIDLGINAPTDRHLGKPVVVWVHHDIDQVAVQWCRDAQAVDGVSRFVFVSHWQMERFLHAFDLPPERCIVIRHATEQGADLRRWAPGPIVRCAYTSTPFRGLDVLLDAWDQLPLGVAELHVWSSMALYAADDAPHQSLLDRCGATPGVIYHGLAPNDELRTALRTMDILVYPSTFPETACLSVIEAMAAGCRVIVPALGALPETTGGYARVYPWCADAREHAATFARTLVDEIAAPWRGRADQGITQQAHCTTVYGWSRCLDEWRALIQDLVGAVQDTRAPTIGPVCSPRPAGICRRDDQLTAGLKRLRDSGFAPSGILDVGAHDGAFARVARRVFPEAHILMIDALDEKDAILKDVASSLGNASHLIALLGDQPGETTPFFVVDTEARPDLVTTGSSMFRENTAFPMNARSVAQQTLAEVINERGRPFQFLKLDVQGAELAVLRGLEDRICDLVVLLIEMSLVAYNENAPQFGAVVAELGSYGFVLVDLVEEHRYRAEALLQVDGLFVRPDSPLRPQPPFWA